MRSADGPQGLLPRAVELWCRFWFSRVRLHPLGLLRVVLAAWCTYRYVPGVIRIAKLDALMDEGLFAWNLGSQLTVLPYPPEGAGLAAFQGLLLVSGIAATIGLFTRVSLAVFGATLLYAFSGAASRGVFNHEQVLTVQVLLVLAVAPGSRAWSVDRLLELMRFSRRTTGTWWSQPDLRWPALRRWLRHLQGPPVERWGLQLLFVLLAVVYCAAGISKIRFSEGAWLNGETLSYYMSGQQTQELDTYGQIFFGDDELAVEYAWKDDAGLVDHAYGYTMNPAAAIVTEHRTLMSVLASSTILFELLGVVLIFGQPWRNLYAIGAVIMHTMIGYTMNLGFIDYRIILLCLIDWLALAAAVRRLPGRLPVPWVRASAVEA